MDMLLNFVIISYYVESTFGIQVKSLEECQSLNGTFGDKLGCTTGDCPDGTPCNSCFYTCDHGQRLQPLDHIQTHFKTVLNKKACDEYGGVVTGVSFCFSMECPQEEPYCGCRFICSKYQAEERTTIVYSMQECKSLGGTVVGAPSCSRMGCEDDYACDGCTFECYLDFSNWELLGKEGRRRRRLRMRRMQRLRRLRKKR